MQKSVLNFSLAQLDDGDGLLRFKALATNDNFSGSCIFWVYANSFSELSALLKGFPTSVSSQVDYSFGSPKTGVCKLQFACVNGAGHVVVWVSIESTYAVSQTKKHQNVEVCLAIEPSAIDGFCNELSGLAIGTIKEATLIGLS